jgi:hypothetical protein
MPATAIGVDTVSALSRQYVMPEIVDAVYDSNVLFHRLTRANKKVVQGGTQIEVPIQYARPNNAQAYSGYDVLNTAPFDVIRNAVFEWKQYSTLVTVDGLTLIKTDNPEAIAQLIKTQFELAKADFCHVLGSDMYRGNATDPKKLTGLAQAVAASGLYGNINHTNTWWQSKIDNTTALNSVGLAELQNIFSQLTIGRENPTLMIGRRAVYNRLWGLIYGTSGANVQINLPAGGADEILASAGFTNILFNNVPLVVDSQVDDSTGTPTNGKLYMLNENWWEVVVSPRADMAMEDFVTPHDQDAMTAKILFAGELICKNPRLQGAFTAL